MADVLSELYWLVRAESGPVRGFNYIFKSAHPNPFMEGNHCQTSLFILVRSFGLLFNLERPPTVLYILTRIINVWLSIKF